MAPTILFILFAILLVITGFGIWRYWQTVVRVSPEEQAYDKRVARLNERQANRMSDEQLREPISGDEAWELMVRRGQQSRRSERYGGNLSRRAADRRRRP